MNLEKDIILETADLGIYLRILRGRWLFYSDNGSFK